jgi:integrase
MSKPLTAKSVLHAKPGAVRREIPDGQCRGLFLIVQPSGAKSWAFRFRFGDKPRKMTIGAVLTDGPEPEQPELGQANTLAGARVLAAAAARDVQRGIDPGRAKIKSQQEAKQRAANALALDRDTVEAVAREFIRRHAMAETRERSWREAMRIIGLTLDDKGELIRSKTSGEVLSRWADRSIHEITRRDVRELLDGIKDRGAPIMANRALSYVGKMFAWAVDVDILTASPCAGLKKLSREKSRDRVLTDDELRLVWRGADAMGWPYGPIVQMLILTLQRREEVSAMHRKELRGDEWVLPASRSKNNVATVVPLSSAVRELLDGLPTIGKSGFVFTVDGDKPFSGFGYAKMQLDEEIARLNGGKPLAPWVLHDLRRTAASALARLGVQQQVVEKLLNHVSGSLKGVAGIYNRFDYAPERRAALEKWSTHVMGLIKGRDKSPKVIAFNRPNP